MKLIIDASVAVKWFLPEAASDLAARLLYSQHDLLAPDLLRLEVGSVLLRAFRRGEMSPAQASRILEHELAVALRCEPTGPLAARAHAVSRDFGGSIYDAAYVALAEKTAAPLVTADGRQADCGSAAGIKCHLLANRLGVADGACGLRRAHWAKPSTAAPLTSEQITNILLATPGRRAALSWGSRGSKAGSRPDPPG